MIFRIRADRYRHSQYGQYMIRFYAPDVDSTGILPETESGHCVRVLRLREGDTVHAVDGRGRAYECEITRAHPKATEVRVVECREEPKVWRPRIVLAVAPTKNIDRMEWLVEKAVEIGIDKIAFLECRHSERRVLKRERIEKIAVSAMKQSLKAALPEITDLLDFNDFMNMVDTPCRVMGYCDAEYPRRPFVENYDGLSDITVLIGPEGDFSPDEVEKAVTAGFLPVTFGDTRLRTETAALYALTAVHVFDDLRGH